MIDLSEAIYEVQKVRLVFRNENAKRQMLNESFRRDAPLAPVASMNLLRHRKACP